MPGDEKHVGSGPRTATDSERPHGKQGERARIRIQENDAETPATRSTTVDALELEIFRHVTSSIVDELEVNLTRTAYSPLIYEYKDYSIGIVTADFELLTQSAGSIPLFLGDLGRLVKDSVAIIGTDRLRDGDILLSNYAPVNGTHLNNVTCATPIFEGDTIVAYVVLFVHWADVGGLSPGSVSWEATEIFHEGFQLRGLRIVQEGEIVPEVLATIQANTRMTEWVTGDLMAQIAACKLGRERWESRVKPRWSGARFEELVNAQAEQSRAIGRAAVAAMPDGDYHASCRLDDAGAPGTDPLPLALTIRIRGDRMVVDFSDMPPQVRAPINTGRAGGAEASCRLAFKQLFALDRPADAWLFEPVEVEIPDGRILSADATAPLGWWNTTPPTVIDLIFRAIGDAHPHLAPAGHHATMGATRLAGVDESGRPWMAIETSAGGFGGHAEGDGFGPLKTLAHSDNRDFSVETMEARFPVRVRSYRLRREAAGRGQHRGGYGTEKFVEVLAPAMLTTSIDRTLDPPWGLAGGEPGQPGSIEVQHSGESSWQPIAKVTDLPVDRGTVLRIRSAGGGGWGAPTSPEPGATR